MNSGTVANLPSGWTQEKIFNRPIPIDPGSAKLIRSLLSQDVNVCIAEVPDFIPGEVSPVAILQYTLGKEEWIEQIRETEKGPEIFIPG